MLTLARFVLEKTGGDSMPEVARQPAPRTGRGSPPPLAAPAAGDGSGGHASGSAAVAAGTASPRRSSPTPARPGRAGTTDRRWTSCSSGCPGSGKTAVGRRLASRHGATFVDLDDQIERVAGRSIPEIFAQDGEAGFRRLERAGRASRSARRTRGPSVRRVISPGGGAIVDPRNRWALYRGRAAGLARRAAGGPRPAAPPLADGPAADPGRRPPRRGSASWPRLGSASTGRRPGVNGVADVGDVVERRGPARRRRARPRRRPSCARRRRSASWSSARGSRRDAVGRGAPPARGARRAVLVSEPGAWAACGEGLAEDAAGGRLAGRRRSCCRRGEAAKRLSVIEDAARDARAAARRAPRAAGGRRRRRARGPGRVPRGDVPAGRARGSACRRRSSPRSTRRSAARPAWTCRRARTWSARSTTRPRSCWTSPSLRPLPERQLRAALGEIVKMAALGDEALFATLEADGERDRRRRRGRVRRTARVAEVVERSAWAKVAVVSGRRARAGRRRADHAQPGAHGRARAGGGRRVRDAAPRRGGRLRDCGPRCGSGRRSA